MNFSKITGTLFIGVTPTANDYPLLRSLGVQLVINMRVEWPPRREVHSSPIPVLWLPTFDTPFIPIPLRVLKRGAQTALEVFAAGGKVYTHCAGGVHRSVAMGAAILIAQGYAAEGAMRLIKTRRAWADPDIWYIRRRILKFAEVWNENDRHAPTT